MPGSGSAAVTAVMKRVATKNSKVRNMMVTGNYYFFLSALCRRLLSLFNSCTTTYTALGFLDIVCCLLSAWLYFGFWLLALLYS